MNTKTLLLCTLSLFLWTSCGGGDASGGSNTQKRTPPKRISPKQAFEEAESNWQTNKGIGPVKDITLGPIDAAMVAAGKEIFRLKCSACHAPYKKKVGPAMVGLTARRRPEWIMNMILNPVEMAKKDPICVGLLAQYNIVMADQQIKEEEARNLLEYLRTLVLQEDTEEVKAGSGEGV